MKTSRRLLSVIRGLVAIIILVLLDQISKHFAVLHLKDQADVMLINGVMKLQYLENRGAAFGILQNQRTLFIVLFIVIVIIAAVFYCNVSMDRKFLPLRQTAILVIAGGTGNLIDRVSQGYVVDFFYFYPIDFPIFNVADIYVTLSMFALILLLLFYYKDDDFYRMFPGRHRQNRKVEDGK